MIVGVQQLDRRSLGRATQLLGSSNGSKISSNSMDSHHLVQQLMDWLLLVALAMRRLRLVGCTDAGEDASTAHRTARAATLVGGSTSFYMQLQ